MLRPSQRREMAKEVVADKKAPINLVCSAFGISESCYRYEAKRGGENDEIADWLIRLTDNHRNWGFGRKRSFSARG
jgi:putative transposase